jgi:2-octaprenyl-6-methoxyphenol hydroxylase
MRRRIEQRRMASNALLRKAGPWKTLHVKNERNRLPAAVRCRKGRRDGDGRRKVNTMGPESWENLRCDVLVAGAGLAGLVAAIGLERAGFEVVLCGRPERLANGRTVALLESSIRFVATLGLWPSIKARAAPLSALRIIDDTGSLWSAAPVEFRAGEVGLDAFGWNVENAELVDALFVAARSSPRLRIVESQIVAYEYSPDSVGVQCENNVAIRASLTVGADGRGSFARRSAGIDASSRPYAQSALTVILVHSRPHRDCSTEFHTRTGPFTLVPLPPTKAGDPRSSLVWVMSTAEADRRGALDDPALAREVETQAQSMLGRMQIDSPRGVFPLGLQTAASLTGHRLALIGDAARALPPIGAQGLNLGLRDAAHLIETAAEARDRGQDIGDAETLSRYRDSRRLDSALRTGAVDGLNRSLLAALPPVDFLRAAGLTALGTMGPLRRAILREGATASFGAPKSMRQKRSTSK